MKKLIIILAILLGNNCYSQLQMGISTTYSKIGINNPIYQPGYGITLNNQFKGSLGKYINLEANTFYNQRMNYNHSIDYLQFMLLGKVGSFNKRIGIFGCYGFTWNPTLDHSDYHNHSYATFIIGMGTQIKLLQRSKIPCTIEFKTLYDCSLTSGYYNYNTNQWLDYNGFVPMCILKINLKDYIK